MTDEQKSGRVAEFLLGNDMEMIACGGQCVLTWREFVESELRAVRAGRSPAIEYAQNEIRLRMEHAILAMATSLVFRGQINPQLVGAQLRRGFNRNALRIDVRIQWDEIELEFRHNQIALTKQMPVTKFMHAENVVPILSHVLLSIDNCKDLFMGCQ